MEMDVDFCDDDESSSVWSAVAKTPSFQSNAQSRVSSWHTEEDCMSALSGPVNSSCPSLSFNNDCQVLDFHHVSDNEAHLDVNLLRVTGILEDSGVFSGNSTASSDFDKSRHHGLSSSESSSLKRSATPNECESAKLLCIRNPGTPCGFDTIGNFNVKVWQSTPANPGKISEDFCVSYQGTPSDLNISKDSLSRVGQSSPSTDSCGKGLLQHCKQQSISDLNPSPEKLRRCLNPRLTKDIFYGPRRRSISSGLSSWTNDSRPSPLNASLVGQQTVDFLAQLGKYSCLQPALDIILGYLEPVDLCRASVVCHSWKNVIESVPAAKNRRKSFVKQQLQMKENLRQLAKKSDTVDDRPHRGQLLDIQNFNYHVDVYPTPTRSPPVSPSKVRFNLFFKEGQKLGNGQTLVQCPHCKLPSRRDSERSARCTRRGCQYYFCVECLCRFHGDKPCPVSVKHRKRQVAIGSRESRRNLQRLCH